MKTMKRFLLSALCALGVASAARADVVQYDADFFLNPSLAYSTSTILEVGRMDSLAMQATISSASISSMSVDDGRKATETIVAVSTSGLVNARITLNGYVLQQGVHWSTASSVGALAANIAAAINAMPVLTDLVDSTSSAAGVVYSTVTYVGSGPNSWPVFSSTPTALTVNAFSNGDDPSFSTTTDKVSLAARHGISTGFALLFSTVSAATPPGGLTNQTTYYAIVTDPYTFKLATSSALSLAGTSVDISSVTGSGSFTFAPTAFAGTYSFKWQSSNDRSNWYDLPVSSTTYSAPTTTMWDGLIYYKYLRLNITAGTGGGLNMNVRGFGKKRE